MINNCLTKTTVKKTKPTVVKHPTTLKAKSSVATTPIAKQKVTECFDWFQSYFENQYYNKSSKKECNSQCFFVKGILFF